jgi:predicted dehydrogenase
LYNSESDASGEEGLKDLKVIEAIYKSIASGTKVKV